MELIYFIVVTSFCVWLLYRNDVWRAKHADAVKDCAEVLIINDKIQKELDFTKSTITGLYNKPVYVTLSTDQVEKIAIMVSMRMKEPNQWPN